ncbi:MAG: helix-turn-helix domain-containing protein [Planctomycetes bacterium]|nr:helix-turn-helix domain-containing protein [Planctomycetota bacterium]
MPHPHSFIKLTPAERAKVSAELKRLACAGEFKKRTPLNILYWSDQGKPFRAIAELTNCSYMTVRRWIYRYRKEKLKPFIKE